MGSPQGLAEDDVREIVRLLADVAIVEGTLPEKKRALMTGLQTLVGADGWLWSVTRIDMPATPQAVWRAIRAAKREAQR